MFLPAYICIFVLLCFQFLTRAESSIDPKKALAMDPRCESSAINATNASTLGVLPLEIRKTPTSVYTEEYLSQELDNFVRQWIVHMFLLAPVIFFLYYLILILGNLIIDKKFREGMYKIIKGENPDPYD